MGTFNASEIFQFAIKIEENGNAFYQQMQDKFSDEEVRKVFFFLAEEEQKHKEFFENLVSEFENYEPAFEYPEEYFTYLRAFADNIVFNMDKIKNEIPHIKTPIEAIDFAIRREWDSISYYQEMKNLVDQDQQKKIDLIIKEEREHFLQLAKLRDFISK